MQNDYIDFKFGDHWASEFNLLAVSSSDRYTPPVYGSVNPNIATIMGKKGVYKWKTQVNEKIFNINIAFDSVTIAQLNQIKQWLQPNKIQKLIFLEEPYKYYWAALNAEIDFSHLPFVEGEKQVGERTIIEGVYKGEMVISFVCIDNDGYSTEGTFEGLETENPSNTIKGNDFVLTDADSDYIEDLKIEGKSKQETKYNNTLSDTDFADVNSRSVEKAWKTNNLAQIQAKNGEVTISAPYQYSGIAQEQREALIDHKYFASAEINTDSLDTALEIAGKNITNSIEGKDINITDGLVGPVDDLIVSGDASQDKLYNNEINSSFLEDLDNWEEINEADLSRKKQTAIIESDKKYGAATQKTEESNIGDKYYLSTKIKADSVDTVLEVETEKGNVEGSNITINDASDNKMRDFKLYGKSQQDNYEEEVLGEGEYITYNNNDNYDKYTKIEVNGNSAQEVIEEVLPTIVEGESITAQDITLPKGRIGVYGNSKQETRSGKNLLDISLLAKELTNGISYAYENDKIHIEGTATAIAPSNVANVTDKLEIGKKYILSLNKSNNDNVIATTSIQYNDGTPMTWVSSFTFAENMQAVNIYLQVSNGTTVNVDVTAQLEKGEVATEYESYGASPSPQYPSPIKVLGDNTNLFNALDNFSARTIIGLTVTPISNDSIIKINGTATADTFSFIGNDIMDIFENGKTYYAYTNNENFEVLFELYGVDVEVPIKTVDNFIMSSEYTIIKLILKGKNLNGKTYNNEEIGIKIEEGKITNYTPYGQGSCSFIIANGDKTQKQEFVLPIQKPMLKEDYFDFKNKKEIHHWSKTAFTGEEKWALNATYTNTIRFSLGVSYLNANKIGYCNRSFIRTTQAHGDYEYMFYSSDLLYFNISKSSLPADKQNLEGFTELLKQWNSEGEPLELYYQTGEIEELTLTDEQIAVGQEIDKAKLYLGTTNIYSDDEIAPYFTLVYNHILPSPSPEAPSEIQNVGDNINYFDVSKITSGSIVINNNDGTLIIKNNPNINGYVQQTKKLSELCPDLKVGDTATLGFKTTTKNSSYANSIYVGEAWNNGAYKTITQNMLDFQVGFYGGYNEISTISDIKIEKGTKVTSFSEYDCGSIGITVYNKNVLNLKNVENQNNCTVNIDEDSLEVNLTNQYNAYFYIKCNLEAGTYYLHLNGPVNSFNIVFYGEDNVSLIGNKYNSEVITLEERCKSIRINTALSDGNYTLSFEDFYINEGNEDLGYVPHEEQIITFPLSGGQKLMKGDYLADDGIHHKRRQIELDGTENWQKRSNTNNTFQFIISEISQNGICNNYKSIRSSQIDKEDGIYLLYTNVIIITDFRFTTVEQFKTWLSQKKQGGNPIIAEYQLLEEEIEAYTEAQQEAYNNLTHLIMYNGQNTLTSSNELKPQLKWEIPESPSPEYPSEIENVTGDIDITVCNKNLFDKNKSKINYILTATGTEIVSEGAFISDYIFVKKGITYFSNTRGYSNAGFYDLDKQFIERKDLPQNSQFIPDNNYYIRLNGKIENIETLQFEIDNKSTEYTQHQSQTIIFPLQEGQKLYEGSYLAGDGIHHKRKQIELDGTENWEADNQAGSNTCVGWRILVDDYVGYEGDFAPHGNILCSHFIDRNTYNNELDGVSGGWGKYIFIKMKKEDLSSPDLTGFKAFLSEQKTAGTPVVVEYELETEKIESYTEEQQEAYNQLCTHREITYIQTTNKFQPNMQIEYTKKPQYQSQLTVANTQQTLSLIYQTNIDDTRILISNIDSNPNTIEFTNPVLINLTKQFGSGKEPTKEWLDTNIDFWDVAEGGAPSVETSSRVKTVGSNINLFDPDNHIELDGQYRHYSEGKVVNSANFFGIKIPVLGNMVYSVNSNLSRGGYSNLCYYNKDSVFMWGEPFTEGQTFRTPFNCRYITLALNKNYDWFTLTYGEIPIQKVDYNLANIDMQISGYDSQFKSFPLAKGQELLQLPNGTQDTLEADGIHKRVEKIIINGTENWLKQNGVNHEKTWRFIFSRTNGSLSSAKNNCYCDKFINYSADDLWNEDIEGIAVSKSQVIIRINSEKAENVVELKQLLQDNNLVLYLPKVSEEIIPYSNAQKAWYDEFEIYRKNTQITTIAETKPWYSFTYDINDTYSVNSTKVNEYEKLGLIFNNLEDRPRFIVNRTAEGSGMIKMRKPLVVDLTNAFGAGKEPDLAWCLENITFDNSCEYGTPSPNVPSELISVGSNPIKIENKSRNLIKEQNLLNWTKEYCTAERLTEKYDNRNIYRISFENHKKGTISTRIQQKKGNMVLSIYARVIQADNPTVNRLSVAKVTSDSSASTVVSHKSLENLIGEWQKIYIPITAESISNAAELVLEIQHNADTDDSTIIDLCMPQLEEGFTPHDYIPYAPEKINNLTFTTPLRQLKNGVRDEFSKDGIIRRIDEHTIKSSDEVYWIVFNQDKSYVTICGQLGIYVRGDNSWDAPSFYCNRIEDCTSLYRIAQAKSPAPSRTKEGIGIIDSEYRMCLRADLMGIVETDTEEDMIRKYKVLLDEKPFTIYYEKEVADIEPLTELQKNTLANLVTRKQYDHWLISGDLNPEVELSYKLTSSINDIYPWVTGSNLLDKTWFYNDNNIHTKPYVEVDTGDADKSGISATRPIYLLNSGTETANLSLTFDYINIETPLTIQTYSGKFTDDGFVEEAKVSEITIEPFTNYQPFKDIYDNNPANWKIEIDSILGEVYLRHNTDETKVLNLNRFNKDHTFLSLADCNFVDYDKVFPTIISEIEGTAIENTIFNKVIIANTADNYRLKNVNVEWKHTYL